MMQQGIGHDLPGPMLISLRKPTGDPLHQRIEEKLDELLRSRPIAVT
jgi:hypothetical protein